MPEVLRFTVPLTPPTVNHYVQHTRQGKHYLTKEAIAFKHAVAIFLPREHQLIRKHDVAVALTVFLGYRQHGDIDNFPKCVLDGLKGHAFQSDAQVKRLTVTLERDEANPHTLIEVAML